MAQEQPQQIQELTLENVMSDRFGRYSKYIIQDRALPDVRDGLKPVQRRILYAMYADNNTYNKAFRKSAKTVGNVIGNYHPHGDSSVYDAMVRMSQDWKMRQPLIDMHGNNGSMDGDPPAAMRYTEARLSKIAGELLSDIDKETVQHVLNFDDTLEEPTVLPASYPNLLVNGATGISAGYATDIPPHNLAEVIDATIHLLKHPNARLETLMDYIQGPDFPTGGIMQGTKGLKKAYKTGKGKIIVRGKTMIESIRGGKEQIVITEIPYEVNKSKLVRKIDDIRIQKKIDGIADVRDETDREGLRIVVEMKRDVDAEGILTYILKHTDLQVSYNLNMIAIDHRRPQQVSLAQILNSYLEHKKDVITKRTTFLLNKAEKRQHIVQGLIKAVSILDKLIKTIRSSENKADAKANIMDEYGFTDAQAEAIVTLQLYRLTNTDITQLQEEADELAGNIAHYQDILSNASTLDEIVKEELLAVKKAYGSPRLTQVEDKIEKLKVETEVLVTEEQAIVTVTEQGYLKRTSLRSYAASKVEELGKKQDDILLFAEELSTLDHLLIFTNKGNVINRPVHELPDIRWKDVGEHLSRSLSLASGEIIKAVYSYRELSDTVKYVFITRDGYIKQTLENEFEPKRTYKSRSSTAIKLKSDEDYVVGLYRIESDQHKDIFIATAKGYGLRYQLSEVSTVGANAIGVKSINLKDDDVVVSGIIFEREDPSKEAMVITHRGSVKKLSLASFDEGSRANRGLKIIRQLKTNPHRIQYVIDVDMNEPDPIQLLTDKDKLFAVNPADYTPATRDNNGSFILNTDEDGEITGYRYQLVDIIETNN
ncbi:DNA topoisomerase IV subunit A [Dolosigranulum pigrum]|uniref:DNA topoisomerase IV subunit A n=1 Tax=Dolosigranulum pigrum TaxID=29394 RepID=UPI001AD85478|nr:DNA topoisomerase IV subunit A [Dolosigranulum pigrum]QTJ41548.1 DNA topoisomerase IV subunit A [Dolosigranulum pigrum]